MTKGQKAETIFAHIFLIYVLTFVFFSLESWSDLRFSFPYLGVFPKHIYFLLGLSLPCFLVVLYFYIIKNKFLFLSEQIFFFSLFILYILYNYFVVRNTAVALEGISFWVLMYLVFFSFKSLFIFHEDLTNNVLKVGLALLGIYFVGEYLVSNFEALMQLSNRNSRYQDVVRFLPSLAGTKNVTAMFLFIVLMLHKLLPSSKKSWEFLHFGFEILALFLLVLIGSRNVYLAMLAFFLVSQFLKRGFSVKIDRTQKIVLLGLLILLITLSVSTNYLNHLLLDTFKSRLKMWQMSFDWFVNAPFNGIGVFHFNIIKPFEDLEYHGHPHSDHVRTLLELGLIGFVLVSSIWVNQIVRAIQNLKSGKSSLANLIAALISLQFLSLFDGIQYKIPLYFLVVIIWAKLDAELEKDSSPTWVSKMPILFQSLLKYCILILGISLLIYQVVFLQNGIIYQAAITDAKELDFSSAEANFSSINQSIFYDGVKSLPIETKLAELKVKQDDQEKALLHFKKALSTFPYHIETIRRLADCYLDRNENVLADKYLKILFAMNNKSFKESFKESFKDEGKKISQEYFGDGGRSKEHLREAMDSYKELQRDYYFQHY